MASDNFTVQGGPARGRPCGGESVGDLDRATGRARELGAEVLAERFDVPGPVARRCSGTRPGRWCRYGRPAGTPGPGW
jgi:hypothetical protein